MKKNLFVIGLAFCALAPVVPAIAQPSVGVSIGINQPGVYGRINIGNYPQPELVYAQPVIIVPAPIAVQRQPIYLYVPTVHQRDWRRYCGRYSACGQPVYFVQDRWVRERWEHEHRDEGRERFERDRDDDHRDRGRHLGHDKKDKKDKRDKRD